MKAAFQRNFSASNLEEEDQIPPVYNLEQIKIEEDFVVQKAALGIWSATSSSAINQHSYAFVF